LTIFTTLAVERFKGTNETKIPRPAAEATPTLTTTTTTPPNLCTLGYVAGSSVGCAAGSTSFRDALRMPAVRHIEDRRFARLSTIKHVKS
jgi:hypothetical protein